MVIVADPECPLSTVDMPDMCWLVPAEDRQQLFLDWADGWEAAFADEDTPAPGSQKYYRNQFWDGLIDIWGFPGRVNHRAFECHMVKNRPYHSVPYRDWEDAEWFDALPGRILVLRGGDDRYCHGGICWTPDYMNATWYVPCLSGDGLVSSNSVMLRGWLRKADIAIAVSRSEYRELVPFSANLVQDIDEIRYISGGISCQQENVG